SLASQMYGNSYQPYSGLGYQFKGW
ncbi:unnamed protein product, partial [Adineta steineri]